MISPADETLIGKTLAEVAEQNDRTPVEQLVEFALHGTPQMRSGVRFRPIAGSAFDVENYMRQVYTATSTDAGVVQRARAGQHPRYFGTYPRKLAYYARERGVISLPFAIRSSTGLPAQIVGLTDRGLIREGAAADLVIFDYDTVQDRATILSPGEMPEGIPYVLVNGEFTVDGARLTRRLPGKVLDRNEVKPPR